MAKRSIYFLRVGTVGEIGSPRWFPCLVSEVRQIFSGLVRSAIWAQSWLFWYGTGTWTWDKKDVQAVSLALDDGSSRVPGYACD
jgi:hypothetical protein